MKSANDVLIRTSRIKLVDGSLFWYEAGQGETVVCLHGSWHNSSQWLSVAKDLATDYHCLVPDLLGFGESSRVTVVPSITLEVEALNSLLTALRVGPCVLAAHSLGAWVALRYALTYPDRVRGLVLIEPEGLVTQQSKGRWRFDRWLTSPFSPLPLGLSLGAPLLAWIGLKPQVRAWRQRRHILRQSPTACQILFRRRPTAIGAELVDPDQLSPLLPTIVLPGQGHTPTQANPLGVESAIVTEAIRSLITAPELMVAP